MYNLQTKAPETGRFVRIWETSNKIFSDTYEIEPNGIIYVYNPKDDDWEELSSDYFDDTSNMKQIRYITLGED